MINPADCPLTGYSLQNADFEPVSGDFIDYTFYPVGRVRISMPALLTLETRYEKYRSVLAGLCRNYFDNKQDAPLITADFIENGLKEIVYPKEFKEKVRHLIKYLYSKGGSEFKSFDLMSIRDYPICYSNSPEEFIRIIEFAEKNYWLEWNRSDMRGGGYMHYQGVRLTTLGIEEIEKELPQVPMIGLVNQSISTGDSSTDEKVNHAKALFFQEPQTFDRMRSACEALSFVLEPMREDLKQYFQKGDVSDFFNIVNNFDIRHNKEQTKSIVYPEQLEWVFYTLLNTINAYTRLRSRLGA